MNSETGQVYTDPEAIRAALKRGEPLEPIGPQIAEMDKNGVPYRSRATGELTTRKERRLLARTIRPRVPPAM